jgi:hypothetical protein
MPRFFIHLRNADVWLEDREGRDLPDLSVALAEVERAIASLSAEIEGGFGLHFEITDSHGRTLVTVPVKDVSQGAGLIQPHHIQPHCLSSGSRPTLH